MEAPSFQRLAGNESSTSEFGFNRDRARSASMFDIKIAEDVNWKHDINIFVSVGVIVVMMRNHQLR